MQRATSAAPYSLAYLVWVRLGRKARGRRGFSYAVAEAKKWKLQQRGCEKYCALSKQTETILPRCHYEATRLLRARSDRIILGNFHEQTRKITLGVK